MTLTRNPRLLARWNAPHSQMDGIGLVGCKPTLLVARAEQARKAKRHNYYLKFSVFWVAVDERRRAVTKFGRKK